MTLELTDRELDAVCRATGFYFEHQRQLAVDASRHFSDAFRDDLRRDSDFIEALHSRLQTEDFSKSEVKP